MFLSRPRFQHAQPQHHAAVESRLAIPRYNSRGSLYQIANAPEVSFYSCCHSWSHTQGAMPLYQIVVSEVQPDRCLKALEFLAKRQSQASQTAHVQPRCRVQPFDVAGRNQVHVWRTRDGPFVDRDEPSRAVFTFGILRIIMLISLNDLPIVHIGTVNIFDGIYVGA